MKKFLLLFASVVGMSGCAAMITPNGEIYTDLIVPTSTVVVEERTVSPVIAPASTVIVEEHTVLPAPSPVIVPSPRPVVVHSPRPVVVHSPRPAVIHSPRPAVVSNPRPLGPTHPRPQRYAKNTGPRPNRGGGSQQGSRPGGAHGAYFR